MGWDEAQLTLQAGALSGYTEDSWRLAVVTAGAEVLGPSARDFQSNWGTDLTLGLQVPS